MNRKTFNKHGLVVSKIARTIMALNVGDHLPTIIELTETFSVSRGIVQNAIARLETDGCIVLHRSGKYGTLIESLDYQKLYACTGWDPIVGAMPVPFNDIFRSLATALFSESRHIPADSSIIYVSGAKTRQSMLKKDFLDYIVTSVATARHIVAHDEDIELLFELPDCRYEEPYCLIFLNENETEIRDGMRVGVDPDTIDQMEITKDLCRDKDVQFVPMPFEGTVETLHNGGIDCSVIRHEKWLIDNLGLSPKALPETAYPANDTTVPAILINKHNYGIKEILCKYFSPEGMAAAQRHSSDIHSRYRFL